MNKDRYQSTSARRALALLNSPQVMLSMCELQDKGKGPYTEISTLLSDMVIQVQEGIKSNLQSVLHALTVVSGNVVLSSLISSCIHVVLLV